MKKFFQSKIVWTGLIQIATAVGSAVVSGTVGGKEIAMAGLGALIVYLRTITTQSIGTPE